MTDPTISLDDRFGIEDLMGRFCWAIDVGDEAALLACFAPDGVMLMGGGRRFEGTDQLKTFAHSAVVDPTAKGRQHLIKPLYFYKNGDYWVMRSYLTILQWDQKTGEKRIRGMSYSDDTCVKTAEGWRIKERRNTAWNGETLPWAGP